MVIYFRYTSLYNYSSSTRPARVHDTVLYKDFIENISGLNLQWQTTDQEFYIIGDCGFTGSLGKPIMAYLGLVYLYMIN